jgi:ribosomal protein S18 acetylase RimI-like enzyme
MINPRAHPESPAHSEPASSAPVIRAYRPEDEQAVLALSLRAWAPVFASLEQALGREIFVRLHGDWRRYQLSAVCETLAHEASQVWVAETEREVVGFVAERRYAERRIGEISMLAVDPERQCDGVGSALTEFATDMLRRAGMHVAMVETGGDPGHAAARRVYRNAGYTRLPVARYFKAL